MSNRRKLRPFEPDLSADAEPAILGKRTEEGTADAWTEEEMNVLRKLSHAPASCGTFIILGLESDAPGMTHIPGYEPMRLHLGGTGLEPEDMVRAIGQWIDAERQHGRSLN